MIRSKIVNPTQVRFLVFIFLLLTVCMSLSGCGGGGGGDSEKGTVVIMVNRSDASFSLDGPSGHVDTSSHPLGLDNSMSVSNLKPGNYTATFNIIGDCLNAPIQDSGLLEAGQVLTLKGNYTGCGPGTIKVYTNNGNASFTITGGEQNFNGNGLDWETMIAPEDSYTITFHSVVDYTIPPPVTKTLTGGQVLIFTGNYISETTPTNNGNINVTSNYPEAVYFFSGPDAFVGDGESWQLNNIPAGTYTITFSEAPGLKVSGAQTVTIQSNQTTNYKVNYTACKDADEDGYYKESGCGTEVDCDDSDADIHPGAIELCYDGIDNNCNGDIDEGCSTDRIIFLDDFEDGDTSGWMLSESGSGGSNGVEFINESNWAFVYKPNSTRYSLSKKIEYNPDYTLSFEMQLSASTGSGNYGEIKHAASGVTISFENKFNVILGQVSFAFATSEDILPDNCSAVDNMPKDYEAQLSEFSDLALINSVTEIEHFTIEFWAIGTTAQVPRGTAAVAKVYFDNVRVQASH